MAGTEQLEKTKIAPSPLILRSRMLIVLGWTLLILSAAMLVFHLLWMWKRMGTGAPLVGIGLLVDALVGIGMIIPGSRVRRKQQRLQKAN
jgi:hypothetical protein